jgi:hypothetical protein
LSSSLRMWCLLKNLLIRPLPPYRVRFLLSASSIVIWIFR